MIVRWKVSGCGNQITRREFKTQAALDKELAWRAGWDRDRFLETEDEAIAFLLDRAADQVRDAQTVLKNREEALRKLRRKYGHKEPR